MRCAQFNRSMRKSTSSAAPQQSQATTSGSTQQEASSEADSSQSSVTLPTRRSSRDCKPPQSLLNPSSSVVSTMPSTQKVTTRGSLSSLTRAQQPSTSLNTTAAAKPVQPHVRTGGRHPHPPTGNNAKLKHKCPFDGCPWRFATPYKLRRHIKSHTKETPYLCKECGRGFSVRYNLLMHIQTIHSQPQKFKCPMRGCKEAFHSQSRLNGHLRRVHKKDWKTLQASEMKATEVNSASASGTTSADSTSPLANSAPPSASQTSTTGSTVKMTGSRKAKHECPTCGKEYPTVGKLNTHLRTHGGDKPFKCSVQGCDKSFTTKEKLNRHTDTHKNTKQFSCPHKNCNRVFLRQSHLKNHLKIHTQDHQFVCPVLDCSQKFSSEGEYNVHLNSHINYGYKCPHTNCDLSFPSRKRLAFHARAVHNVTSPTPDSGCTSPSLLDGIQPHLGLPNHRTSLPLHTSHTFTHSQNAGSSSKPHLLRYVNKEIIKDVDLPGLSVEDIEAILSENEDWSGEQMDQFLRSAIDLSDIEAKVLSGGYESDSGYSTYDVSPITSSAPAQLPYPTSAGTMAAMQQGHTHHMEQAIFNLSPTASMFPGPHGLGQPSTSLLHDSIHSPCSSDVGFFSPHSGFSSHATTPSHQDTLSFFPAHGPCPMFTSYSQPQDFNSLDMSSCFPNSSMSNSDSTIPSFSSQIPDILLPDSSLAPVPLSMPSAPTTNATPVEVDARRFPKPEPVQAAGCQVQPPPQVMKSTKNSKDKNTESAAEVKSEPLNNSCAFACKSEVKSKGRIKTEQVEESRASSSDEPSQQSPQVLLTKLLGQTSTPPTIVSITAINNNGTTTKLNLSQLQAIVGKSAVSSPSKTAATKPAPLPSSSSEDENTTDESPSKVKSSACSPKTVPMKASQKKKGQWPRSMSKANLMAFREHILNKLKKGQESMNGASGDVSQKEMANETGGGKVELMKCETPSPSTSCEVNVTYERNRSAESRCHSEPAEMFIGSHCSPNLQLQSSHSESYLHSSASTHHHQATGTSEADTKLADFFPQNCNDVLNLFQFNPDALLSTTLDDHLLDGIDLCLDEEDSSKLDNEIARFLDSDASSAVASESPMEIVGQYDMLTDHSPIMTPPLSHHASPLVSPATYHSGPPSPQKGLSRSCSHSSVSPTAATPYLPERTLITGHVTTGPMTSLQMGMFNFPDMLTGRNEMGGVSHENEMKLHIQQNLLQAHHDPLLTGNNTILQACGAEAFEF